jgi:hypothetical protein
MADFRIAISSSIWRRVQALFFFELSLCGQPKQVREERQSRAWGISDYTRLLEKRELNWLQLTPTTSNIPLPNPPKGLSF